MLLILPNYINELFNLSSPYTGTVKALILYVICPFIFYFTVALIKNYISKENLKQSLSQLVLSILPIAASMHLLKALLKTTSRFPYWNFALKDSNGVESAKIIIQNHHVLKNYTALPTFSLVIDILSILILLPGLALSSYIILKNVN